MSLACGLLAFGFFTKNNDTKTNGFLDFDFTKNKTREARGFIALPFLTFKFTKGKTAEADELLDFDFTNTNGMSGLLRAGIGRGKAWI